jgi:hypothetical protein
MTLNTASSLEPPQSREQEGWAAAWCQTFRQIQSEAIDFGISTARFVASPRAWMAWADLGTRQWMAGLAATWEECSRLAAAQGRTLQAWWSRPVSLWAGGPMSCAQEVCLDLTESWDSGLRAHTLTALQLQARAARFWGFPWTYLDPGTPVRETRTESGSDGDKTQGSTG